MPSRPVIFLTDFGDADEFAGVCRAVIESRAPGTTVIDLAHEIAAGDVRRGALALEAAAPYLPPTPVILAVVDPGVGTQRRALAIRAGAGHLVGPDNGLLIPAAEALGGVDEAIDISSTPFRLEPTSNTFHGRDIFAPVAAALARGGRLDTLGEPLDPSALVPLQLPEPSAGPGRLTAHILYADAFGNLILDARAADLEAAGLSDAESVSVAAGDIVRSARRGRTFADGGGGLVLYDDSGGRLGLALSGASAQRELLVGPDDKIAIAAA